MMQKLIYKIIARVGKELIYELKFIGHCLLRWLELVGQIFPSDERGCKIRGLFYRPFLKKCGKNFQVAIGAKFENLDNIEIGNDVYIGPGCWVCGIRGGIVMEDQVMLGPKICIISSNHTPINNSFRFGPGIGAKIVIGRGTWIASNCVITAGVNLGSCCLVAAGSIVTKNFESFSIIGGIPAKQIGNCHDKYSI